MSQLPTKPFLTKSDGRPVVIVSPVTIFSALINDQNLMQADNAGAKVTDPNTALNGNATSHSVLTRQGREGKTVALRLRYVEDDTTPITVQLSGQPSTEYPWELMYARDGSWQITITPNPATDYTDGTYFYTDVDPQQHEIPCRGNDRFVANILVAPTSVLDGSMAGCQLEAKITD